GGHRVGPPYRWLPKQARRNERGGGHVFLPAQKAERNEAERQQPERQRNRAQFHALHLFETENPRTAKEDEEHQAESIERGTASAMGGRNAKHEKHGKQTKRDIDQKDRLPAECLCEIATSNRSEGIGAYGYPGEIALIAAALARRHRFTDQCLRQRHEAAAAE